MRGQRTAVVVIAISLCGAACSSSPSSPSSSSSSRAGTGREARGAAGRSLPVAEPAPVGEAGRDHLGGTRRWDQLLAPADGVATLVPLARRSGSRRRGIRLCDRSPSGGTDRRPLGVRMGTRYGRARRCLPPSKSIRDNIPPYAGELANGNALVVATDYEGLGTPGEHTYLAGRPEGQAVLDSVRATAKLPGAGRIGGVVVAGQSQGRGAALFAAQLAQRARARAAAPRRAGECAGRGARPGCDRRSVVAVQRAVVAGRVRSSRGVPDVLAVVVSHARRLRRPRADPERMRGYHGRPLSEPGRA